MRSLGYVYEQFASSQLQGLSPQQVEHSRTLFGINRLTPLPHEPAWRKFLAKFDDPIIKILLAASLLKIIIDVFELQTVVGLAALVGMLLGIGLTYLLKYREWIPTLLFVLAGVFFLLTVGLGSRWCHPTARIGRDCRWRSGVVGTRR